VGSPSLNGAGSVLILAELRPAHKRAGTFQSASLKHHAEQGLLGPGRRQPAKTPGKTPLTPSRVVLAPVAGVKSAEEHRPNRARILRQFVDDGDNKNSSPRRARYKP
jgi:hypothetical protein